MPMEQNQLYRLTQSLSLSSHPTLTMRLAAAEMLALGAHGYFHLVTRTSTCGTSACDEKHETIGHCSSCEYAQAFG